MRGLRGLSRLGKASASLVVGVGGCATLAPSFSRAEAVPVDAAPAQASTAALAGRTKQKGEGASPGPAAYSPIVCARGHLSGVFFF